MAVHNSTVGLTAEVKGVVGVFGDPLEDDGLDESDDRFEVVVVLEHLETFGLLQGFSEEDLEPRGGSRGYEFFDGF